MTRPLRFLAIALCGWLLPWLAHAQVQASLDRSTAQLGDTVTLNLHSRTAPLATPDLSPLAGDFQVLGQSSGSTSSFVNGQRSVEYSYGVALRPLHQGTLHIPPLTVGSETTQPLTLQVTAPSAASQAATGPVFVEATVDPTRAYVGQQLSLSVKLYYTANLANASLGDPRIDGVDVSRIGGDTDYQAERNGRTYNVIERRYVLVPQRPGELTIPPIPFQGDLLDPSDPDSFLGMGAPVSAQSRPLTVTIRPAPADWGSAAWLPARKLSLTLDGLPDAATPLRVGQPFNLTLTMEATGLPFEALPALSLPALDGATAYPDKPVTGNREDGPWVVGRRQQAFAIVPGKAGTLTVPAIAVKWWDVLTDRAETATIPAHRFTVLSAAGTPAPAVTPPAAAGSSVPAAASSTGAAAEGHRAPSRGLPWSWIALGSLGLWLVTVPVGIVWWRRRRSAAMAPSPPAAAVAPSAREARQAFLRAAREADAAEQAQRLLAWAQAERPGLRHLDAVAAALASPEQIAAIDALQRARYASSAPAPDREALARAFAQGFAWRRDAATSTGPDPLPPLYPFTLC
ncbi:BatD family protein [Dyella sp. KRB-257]|uniref:BatD family protein n=1 Tax=Dyella sp. KRB-257 TaxID=3400915 RepID=UPI003C04CC6B